MNQQGPVERERYNRVLNAARHYHNYAKLLELVSYTFIHGLTGRDTNEELVEALEGFIKIAAKTLYAEERFVPFQDNEAAAALDEALKLVQQADAEQADANADEATAAILKDILQ